jgi:putative endonuclease
MKSENRKFGDEGELLAFDYLKDRGFIIIEKNWTVGHKEIDLVAFDRNILVFIEVKTRKSIKGLSAEDVLSESKRLFLLEAAEKYVEEKNISNEIRFDLLLISLQGQKKEFYHIKDAFNAEL